MKVLFLFSLVLLGLQSYANVSVDVVNSTGQKTEIECDANPDFSRSVEKVKKDPIAELLERESEEKEAKVLEV